MREIRERQVCEIYSRIVGYIRPISDANEGKREEIKSRKMFKLPKEVM